MVIRSLPLRRLLAGAAVPLLLLTSAGCGLEKTEKKSDDSPSAGGSPAAEWDGTCEYPQTGGATKEVEAPAEKPDLPETATVTLKTSVGDLTLDLSPGTAPCTVNSFVSLAEQGYFDDTPCHRLTTDAIKVLQCGDPSGQGNGGPGYSFADELSGEETYGAGTLAMANSGPDTNGSQFFLVYGEGSFDLPPSYTVFGTLSEETVKTLTDVAAEGTQDGSDDGAPKREVRITEATVS